MKRSFSVLLAMASLLASCDGSGGESGAPISTRGLFEDARTQTPSEGVEPYEIVAPLFSDYASKHRFIQVPEGERITVGEDGYWDFPVGTILVKTFGFPIDARDPSLGERIIETRLLIREEDRWRPEVYIWNDDVSEAYLTPAGRIVPVSFVDAQGETVELDYRVPSHTQCSNCHRSSDGLRLRPLGPRTAQMDRMHAYADGAENQIDHLVEAGWLDARPATDDVIIDYEAVRNDPEATFEEIDAAARSYLHANCSHCHRDGGPADQSGLFLEIEAMDRGHLGVCKVTVSGGCDFGRAVIQPGAPDASMMVCRMESTEAGIKMPELPTVLAHTEGVDLIRRWIAAMPPDDCGFSD
ncbi:SO2930 family diheme c-type cytochrome [Sandaracinus amylolyticus]|uniref:SO2930 family diheme c-type cytochrome n=1 Tax=Sandaracinus amylolyticus TaxID=927083 RepID=UPI001F377663|nr:SO2930 family diheme c-type cytochrome [Sandaracinus amylolyticus]UJR81408.1 Cytochrome c domain-containing protein [Sandaracinus amylolyticus]